MKKLLFALILSIFCLASYAQKTFTEATFTDMMNRLQTDPAFFKNETDPSFIITFGNGNTSSQEAMVKFAEDNVGLYKRKHANLKVSQVGSTGIATGTVTESFLSKDNPSIVRAIYEHLFTYTFSQVKGKWLWVSGQHTEFRSTKEADEAAIKKMLEAETLAGWANDTEKEFSYWSQTPYASFIGAADNKAYYILGIDGIKKFAVEAHKSNRLNPSPTPTLQNSKYFFRINGNTAFVTYQQEQNKEGKIGLTRENRYLEKVNGNWKVVNATFIVDASNSTSEYSVFSATTMKEIFDEYKNDSKAFMNNRLSEDFRFTNPKGNYQPQKDFLGGTAQSIVSAEMLQPVIFQSGDLAVTSGIHHNILTNKDGNQYTRDVAATYTWQRRNGKWMFVGSQQNNITAPVAEDEAAIKNVIEGESTAFYQRNADQVLTYWAKSPYASHSYTEKGTGYIRGYDMWSSLVKKYISDHPELSKGSFKNRDYIIHVNGTSAWATFIQDQSAGDKKSISYGSRYLEKDNSGAWKIVGNSSSAAK